MGLGRRDPWSRWCMFLVVLRALANLYRRRCGIDFASETGDALAGGQIAVFEALRRRRNYVHTAGKSIRQLFFSQSQAPTFSLKLRIHFSTYYSLDPTSVSTHRLSLPLHLATPEAQLPHPSFPSLIPNAPPVALSPLKQHAPPPSSPPWCPSNPLPSPHPHANRPPPNPTLRRRLRPHPLYGARGRETIFPRSGPQLAEFARRYYDRVDAGVVLDHVCCCWVSLRPHSLSPFPFFFFSISFPLVLWTRTTFTPISTDAWPAAAKTKQNHLPPPAHRPLEARPRFRPLAPRHPSARHLAVLESHPEALVVVGVAGR